MTVNVKSVQYNGGLLPVDPRFLPSENRFKAALINDCSPILVFCFSHYSKILSVTKTI